MSLPPLVRSLRFRDRPARFIPRRPCEVSFTAQNPGLTEPVSGRLENMGPGGLCAVIDPPFSLSSGTRVGAITLLFEDGPRDAGAGSVLEVMFCEGLSLVRVVFDEEQSALVQEAQEHLNPAPYVTDELDGRNLGPVEGAAGDEFYDITKFYKVDSDDLFAKCDAFQKVVKNFQQRRMYQTMYRVTLTSGLDHRVAIYDPIRGCEREMICFDSNSYLGLHRHPRVVEAARRVLDQVGYGTPSSQMLGGTNRHLRELEETLSAFHKRKAAIIFPSGYGANHGTITALVRPDDAVVRDQFSHASIHDACRSTGSRFSQIYRHCDMESLAEKLDLVSGQEQCRGKMIITDGVFSMHGAVAPLPEIFALAQKHGARILLDEAHATGVFGETGRGLEELYGMEGCVDILMGTFSKVPGTVGGYVCGDKSLIDYLRFYARSSLFTAALPAHLCAGIQEAFRLVTEEPEHRERLWENVEALAPRMSEIGLIASGAHSPILTAFVGTTQMLASMSAALFDSGIKCGNVDYPAVPPNEAVLRLSVNARHTQEDMDRTIDVLEKVGRAHGILGRSREEIVEIGRRAARLQ